MKSEKLSLAQLGIEYEKHIELQNFFIEKCRQDIKKAKKSGDIEAVYELNSDLQKFYQIKRELKETANKLKNYYKGENNG